MNKKIKMFLFAQEALNSKNFNLLKNENHKKFNKLLNIIKLKFLDYVLEKVIDFLISLLEKFSETLFTIINNSPIIDHLFSIIQILILISVIDFLKSFID